MKVGFAGAGNMAAAMARGWAAGDGGPEAMLFCDAGSGRAAALAARARGGGARQPLRAGRGLRPRGARGQAGGARAGGRSPRRGHPRGALGSRRDPGRAASTGLSGRAPVPRDAEPARSRSRRGLICHAPPQGASDDAVARGAGAARAARPHGGAGGATDRRGDGGHGLLARLLRPDRRGARRRGGSRRSRRRAVAASSSLEALAGTAQLLRDPPPRLAARRGRLARRQHRGGPGGTRSGRCDEGVRARGAGVAGADASDDRRGDRAQRRRRLRRGPVPRLPDPDLRPRCC